VLLLARAVVVFRLDALLLRHASMILAIGAAAWYGPSHLPSPPPLRLGATGLLTLGCYAGCCDERGKLYGGPFLISSTYSASRFPMRPTCPWRESRRTRPLLIGRDRPRTGPYKSLSYRSMA
jgi:hypothetical protein